MRSRSFLPSAALKFTPDFSVVCIVRFLFFWGSILYIIVCPFSIHGFWLQLFYIFFYTFSYKSCDNACSNVENKSKMLRSEMRAAILDFGTASKGIFLVILVTWHEVVHEHFYVMSKISQSMSTYLAFKSFCSVLSIFGEYLLIWLSSRSVLFWAYLVNVYLFGFQVVLFCFEHIWWR